MTRDVHFGSKGVRNPSATASGPFYDAVGSCSENLKHVTCPTGRDRPSELLVVNGLTIQRKSHNEANEGDVTFTFIRY